jgi:hypothetical protein
LQRAANSPKKKLENSGRPLTGLVVQVQVQVQVQVGCLLFMK